MPVVKLTFSPRAWDYLAQEAASKGWCNDINTESRPSFTTRGIGRFIGTLPNIDYVDSRPIHMLGTGVWYEGAERSIQHVLSLPAETIQSLAKLAMRFMILPKRVQTLILNDRIAIEVTVSAYIDLVSKASERELAGAVLEAIGVRYLSPITGFVQAPDKLFSRPTRIKWRDRRQGSQHAGAYGLYGI